MTFNHSRRSLLSIVQSRETWLTLNELLPAVFPGVNLVFATPASIALSYLDTSINDGDPPQLILLDIYLPSRADGMNLLQKLKQPDSPYQAIPVVMMSSTESTSDINEVMRLGAAAYVVRSTTSYAWIKSLQGLQDYWPV
ncbi:response regulator [Spirosoma aureum]|uniref:Response regulator n=1 Tax=Spirosoma aureum TaxID=2692134 RepID=A0A6G9AWJ3_9BACT|nr:response regulator [Spirosoma aureum]QIP16842.1 response regulator [Spirosoma aureum]